MDTLVILSKLNTGLYIQGNLYERGVLLFGMMTWKSIAHMCHRCELQARLRNIASKGNRAAKHTGFTPESDTNTLYGFLTKLKG